MSPHAPTERSPIDFGRRPMLVFWEVTRACQLACTHCRASAQAQALPGELTHTEGLDLIDQVAGFGLDGGYDAGQTEIGLSRVTGDDADDIGAGLRGCIGNGDGGSVDIAHRFFRRHFDVFGLRGLARLVGASAGRKQHGGGSCQSGGNGFSHLDFLCPLAGPSSTFADLSSDGRQ